MQAHVVLGANAEDESQGNAGGFSASAAVSALCCLVLLVVVYVYGRGSSATCDKQKVPKASSRKTTSRIDLERELLGGVSGDTAESPGETSSPAFAALKKRSEREQRREERREQARAAAAAVAPSTPEDLAPSDTESQALSHRAAKQEAYKKRQAERERIQAEKEAEKARAEEARRLKEQEEYNEWKKEIVVEAEGEMQVSPEEEAAQLEKFLEFIRVRKAVELEDIAAEFHLKTKECVSRIESLREAGRLSGVLDDRGRFLHLTAEEKQTVASALTAQGRISKEDLVRICNRIIKLVPSEEDKKRIEEERQASMRLVQLAAADD